MQPKRLPPAAALAAEVASLRAIGSRLATWVYIWATREGCGESERAQAMRDWQAWGEIPAAKADGRRGAK